LFQRTSIPTKVQASIFPDPSVGQEVNLFIEMIGNGRDLSKTLLIVELSEGVELVQGELTWEGASRDFSKSITGCLWFEEGDALFTAPM
jgi:hypothetical protein